MREMLKYGLILGFICFLSSSVLAIVNNVTEPKIRQQKEKEESSAFNELMPESLRFEARYRDEKIIYFTAFDNNNKLSGFIVKAKAKGYSSDIETAAGLALNLEIRSLKILSQDETPGLGNRITEASFLGQFQGKNADTLNDVQAITGASISSRGVINSLRDKIQELKEQLLFEANHG
ncbi:FMN-binding protein [bacterium]|nr:MAG: FMN-binding protein [bacterium]